MQPRHLTHIFVFILILFVFRLLFHLNDLLIAHFFGQYTQKSFLQSGIHINSFNSPLLHTIFNTSNIQCGLLTIIDNDHVFLRTRIVSNTTSISLGLSNGYHRLDVIILDQIKNHQYHDEIHISIGMHSIFLTIIDENNQRLENITVQIELMDHPSIYLQKLTNQFGQVTFDNLPVDTNVYIDGICRKTKRYGYLRTFTYPNQNLTLILSNVNEKYDDVFD